MQVKIPPLEKRYGPVVLYRDDLKRLYNAFNQSGKSIKIETDKFKFDSWEEFIENSDNTETIIYSTTDKYLADLTLTIYRTYSSLSSSASSREAILPIFHHVDSIIYPLRRRDYWLTRPGIIGAELCLFVTLFMWPPPLSHEMIINVRWLLGFIILITANIAFHRFSKIIWQKDRDVDSFWNKNKTIIISVIGLLIALANFLLGVLKYLGEK